MEINHDLKVEIIVEEPSIDDGAPNDDKYYINRETNKIYNSTSEYVANFVDGKFVFINNIKKKNQNIF